ncbi:hypothetical protein D3C72_1565030 [compost metagenome]
MINPLVAKAAHRFRFLNSASSAPRLIVADALACGTMNVMTPAHSTASTTTSQKLARQPQYWSMTVAMGTPSTVASINPPITMDAARPRDSMPTISAQIASDTPKHAEPATPVATRAMAMSS